MHAGRDLRQIFARPRRNVRILVTAKNVGALGPTLLGIFLLIQAYVAVFGRAFVLDTWQAVSALALALDLASGICAAGIGLVVLATAGDWIGLSETYQWLAALFALTVLVHFASAPAGIFRALHRFSLAALIELGEAALKGPLTILHIGMGPYLESNLVAIIWLILPPPLLILIGPAGGAWAEGTFVSLWASLNALSLYRRRTLFQ